MKDESEIVLGIELSSRQGSVALLKDGELLGEKTWVGERVRHNTVFQTLETLLHEVDISYYDISLYAVGRGPGSFSGMRMSFAIAQALALPNKTEVRAVSSGAALAFAAARDGAKDICVVGDARRGQFWAGFFSATANGRECARIESPPLEGRPARRGGCCVNQTGEWNLVLYEELVVPEGTVVVSPEAERLAQYFPLRPGSGQAIIGSGRSERGPVIAGKRPEQVATPRFPLASDVAALAVQGISEPLEPLYMHPPVFIEPKFG